MFQFNLENQSQNFKLYVKRNTTYYKLNILHHEGLTMIKKILTLLSCIYV